MHARSIALALSLALLASCGGGPTQSEIDLGEYITTIHSTPRIMATCRDDASVADAEKTFDDWGNQLDDTIAKVKGQKIGEPQKTHLKKQLDDELNRIEQGLKDIKIPGEADKLTPAQRDRLDKACEKFLAKARAASFN